MLEPGSSLSRHCDVPVAHTVTTDIMPVCVINVTEEGHTLCDGIKIWILSTNIEVGEGVEVEDQECSDCASQKLPARNPQAPLCPPVMSRPYEHVSLDILGLLPETMDKNIYKYLRYILVLCPIKKHDQLPKF